MKVVCVASAKGGAGKTTLAINLAALAAERGQRSLIIDLDKQASASDWRKVRTAASPFPRVAAPGEFEELPNLLEAARAEGIDLVVLDTPPQVTRRILLAAEFADLVLVPMRPSVLDLRSGGRLLHRLGKTRKPYAVVLNACPITSRGEPRTIRESRETLAPHPVLPFHIAQRSAFQHALIDGRAVNEYEPEGKAAAEVRTLGDWVSQALTKS